MKSLILKTLVYSDLFDYSLKEKELWYWLFSSSNLPLTTFKKALKSFENAGGYYFLNGRQETVNIRKQREVWSKPKLVLAKIMADKLAKIPTIKMIGLTGALAMNNAQEDDDIDFLIITSSNTLWLTRILIWLICPIYRIRRRKANDKNVKDKICFNLFLDESNLKIEPKNLFLAHEICQVKPLVNKEGTYEKFLWENQWVKNYLPNAVIFTNKTMEQCSNKNTIVKLLNCLIAALNHVAYGLQYRYMQPKITSEKVSLTQAFFHPGNLGEKILEKYQAKLASVGLTG